MLGQAGFRELGSSTLQRTTVCAAYQLFQAQIKIKIGGKISSNVIADYDVLVSVPELFCPCISTFVTNDVASFKMICLCVALWENLQIF